MGSPRREQGLRVGLRHVLRSFTVEHLIVSTAPVKRGVGTTKNGDFGRLRHLGDDFMCLQRFTVMSTGVLWESFSGLRCPR